MIFAWASPTSSDLHNVVLLGPGESWGFFLGGCKKPAVSGEMTAPFLMTERLICMTERPNVTLGQ